MSAIDIVGIILIVGIVFYGVYKILKKDKSGGCGCGGEGKCSKSKNYDKS